jgi:biofilm PGA synthesis N-glycosyltransferase PgaC
MMHHMLTGHRVGAVTGNPRVRNRSTLLGKIQVGEFSAIIGLLKRAQRVYGRIFTATGAVSAYRKSALYDVGSWSVDMLTEDLDVSWKLQLASWDIRYEPNALCWILMPETFGGLWRQRLRWAQGGVEVLLRHSRDMFAWRRRRMWGVYVEYLTSLAWACAMGFLGLLWFGRFLLELPSLDGLSGVLPEWAGVMLGTACLLQFAVSLWLDGRYERGLGRHYYWMIWYPLVYWASGMSTAVVAIPRTLIGPRRRATWESPDRGVGSER